MSDPVSHSVVGCLNEYVIVPEYLKPIFGKFTPAFPSKEFGVSGSHDINGKAFKLLITWLLQLVMRMKLPKCDDLIANEMCIDEWLHIANYFDIPIFVKLFTELQLALQK